MTRCPRRRPAHRGFAPFVAAALLVTALISCGDDDPGAPDHPTPTLDHLSPDTIAAGSDSLMLTLTGDGFIPGSVVQWNGVAKGTNFGSERELMARLGATDLLQTGPAEVRVSNPGPGGGASAPETVWVVEVPPPAPPLLRVLYIGNSLTYTNSLPEMADSLAAASGLRIESRMMTSPSFALIDHWNIPERRQQVEQGHYDVVIMQQGPSSLPESRVLLRQGVQAWAPLIRAAGGRPAMYAVWPEKSRSHVFADVSASYRIAAEDVDGLFFPVGDTWLETWARSPTAPLYGPDSFHPSVAGTYAAAVVIVSILGNRDAESLAPRFTLPPGVGAAPDSTLAATIRAAAAAVIGRLPE